MNYLVIYTDGAALRDSQEVACLVFVSNPELAADGCDAEARPNTADMEEAIGDLADRAGMTWEGNRQFVVVPLAAAFTANAARRASCQVGSTGSIW